jgi:hypothetical protein
MSGLKSGPISEATATLKPVFGEGLIRGAKASRSLRNVKATAVGEGYRFPNHRPIRRAQDGAPDRLGRVEESGRLLPQTIPTLATMKLSRRWGTRFCGGPSHVSDARPFDYAQGRLWGTGNCKSNRRSFDCGGKSAAFAQDDNFIGW